MSAVTEEKAAGMACPMTLHRGPLRCHGARCMAWRWVDESLVCKCGRHWSTGRQGNCTCGGTLMKTEPQGYCGLVGKVKS